MKPRKHQLTGLKRYRKNFLNQMIVQVQYYCPEYDWGHPDWVYFHYYGGYRWKNATEQDLALIKAMPGLSL
jgi:hypothetical protein